MSDAYADDDGTRFEDDLDRLATVIPAQGQRIRPGASITPERMAEWAGSVLRRAAGEPAGDVTWDWFGDDDGNARERWIDTVAAYGVTGAVGVAGHEHAAVGAGDAGAAAPVSSPARASRGPAPTAEQHLVEHMGDRVGTGEVVEASRDEQRADRLGDLDGRHHPVQGDQSSRSTPELWNEDIGQE